MLARTLAYGACMCLSFPYKCDGRTVVSWFINAFVFKQFGSQTETFGKILYLFAHSALGDKYDCRHLS